MRERERRKAAGRRQGAGPQRNPRLAFWRPRFLHGEARFHGDLAAFTSVSWTQGRTPALGVVGICSGACCAGMVGLDTVELPCNLW